MKKVVGRSATRGSSSGRFHPPLEVSDALDGRIHIFAADQISVGYNLWPDEAIELASALLEVAYAVRYRSAD